MEDNEMLVKFAREELYRKLWTTSMVQLAEDFGTTYAELKKICQEYQIPTPPKGYWAKKQFGKEIEELPLPKIDDPDLETVCICKICQPEKEKYDLPSEYLSLIRAESDPAKRIVVPKAIRCPHPLIAQAKRLIGVPEYPGRYPYLQPTYEDKVKCPDISVSRKSFSRALRIMNSLFRAIEKRKHTVAVVGVKTYPDYGSITQVELLGQKFNLRLREMLKRCKPDPEKDIFERSTYLPTGILSLEVTGIYTSHSWKDGRHRLEEVLNSVISYLITKAGRLHVEQMREEQEERERKEREAIEAERRRQEKELQRQKKEQRRQERDRRNSFVKEVKKWDFCRNAKAYLKIVEDAISQNHCSEDSAGELQEWLKWAREFVSIYDPLPKRIKPAK